MQNTKKELNIKSYYFLSQTENGYDFVTIYDGPSDQSTQKAKLSGNLGSFTISSTGNFMFVKFESNNAGINYAGFLATIKYSNSYLHIK